MLPATTDWYSLTMWRAAKVNFDIQKNQAVLSGLYSNKYRDIFILNYAEPITYLSIHVNSIIKSFEA